MLNPRLDGPRWTRQLAASGRIQIPDFLQADAAEMIAGWLATEVPWTLAVRTAATSHTVDAADYRALDPSARLAIVAQAAAEAGTGFSFAYESYQMITNYLEQRDPGLALHRVTEFLNSEPFVGFCRQLTGDESIIKSTVRPPATDPGIFLTRHDDRLEPEGRRFAYVLGFTKDWRADWGGLLQFLDANGAVCETLMPRFNTLSIFKVPVDHCVSIVAPFAETGRYSITGWMRAQ